jgi:hypothetical protein
MCQEGTASFEGMTSTVRTRDNGPAFYLRFFLFSENGLSWIPHGEEKIVVESSRVKIVHIIK